MSEPSEARVSHAARGAVFIGAAKGWFLAIGFVQAVLLPKFIGQGGFGAYKRATAFANLVNNVLVAASIQTVARAIAQSAPGDRPATLRRALGLQVLVGLLVAFAFFLAIPAMTAYQHDAAIAKPLRAMSIVLFAYAVYAPLVGALNGERRFGAQAALDAGYATGRTILLIVLGSMFAAGAASTLSRGAAGAYGATVGFAIAAVAIVPITLALSHLRGAGRAHLSHRSYLAGLFAILLMQLLQTASLQIDVLVLGRAATLWAEKNGLAGAAAADAGDHVVGLYGQAQAFGLVPYQLLLAASLVLFPEVAEARAKKDPVALRQSLAGGGRLTFLAGGFVVAALASAPRAVLFFVYGNGGPGALAPVGGANVLTALALAHLGTALVGLAASVLAAAELTVHALVVAALAFVLGGAGIVVGSRFPSQNALDLASHVALGLALGMAVALTLALVIVARALAPMLSARNATRVIVALAAALVVGHFIPLPHARLLCALPPLVGPVVYVAVVTLLGERFSRRWKRG